MAGNALQHITKAAKALRRKHPKMAWKDAVAKASAAYKRTHKPAGVGKVKKRRGPQTIVKAKTAVIGKAKKSANPIKKIERTIKKALGISGISHAKIGMEMRHCAALNTALAKHQAMLKQKGLTVAEKARIRRDISHYKNAIAASKKHINALKRSL